MICVSDLERLDAMRLGKWLIFNGDDTGRDFHVFYDGKEIEMVTAFSMDVSARSIIKIKVECMVPPR